MAPLTLEQVLDELADLATVAHAQIIEFLFIRCALGNQEIAPEGADAVTRQIAEAASGIGFSSRSEMRLLRQINHFLVAAGRDPSLARATHVESGAAPTTELAPLTAAQLDGLLDHQLAIARAVDERLAQLRARIEAQGAAVLGEDLAAQIGFILSFAPDHAAVITSLRDALGTLTPSQYLPVNRDEPADDVERGLRDLSDRYYEFVIAVLHAGFANPDLESTMVGRIATGAMDAWDAVNSQLADRRLLPAFAPPSGF
ncbi:MAG: hypothetical protein QOE31_2225 [Solirubrobacteraceae bacterium]|nr:hypothetical protein [Solirubrobacteraceae bacterium]